MGNRDDILSISAENHSYCGVQYLTSRRVTKSLGSSLYELRDGGLVDYHVGVTKTNSPKNHHIGSWSLLFYFVTLFTAVQCCCKSVQKSAHNMNVFFSPDLVCCRHDSWLRQNTRHGCSYCPCNPDIISRSTVWTRVSAWVQVSHFSFSWDNQLDIDHHSTQGFQKTSE